MTIDPTTDQTAEGDETVILTLTANAAYTIGSPSGATGTITNDDPTPTIQITNVTAAEPNPASSTTFAFTVSLTNPSSSQITVNYATTTTGAPTPATGGPGCTAGVDFVNTNGPLTFLASETSKQVNVTVCGDSTLEPDEIFFVELSGNTNSVLPPNTKGHRNDYASDADHFHSNRLLLSMATFAIAVNSVTFARGPFKLIDDYNFSADRATRVILLTSDLGMTDANLASGILSLHIAGYGQIPLANIEHVGPITGVPLLSASYIIVKLPDNLPNTPPGPNNLTLTVKMGSATSNAAILSIVP